MKKQTILLAVIGIIFLLPACQQEDSSDIPAAGYLVLDEIAVVLPEVSQVEGRAVDADFYVTLASAASTTTYNPGNFPTGKLPLEPGSYTITVENAAYRNNTANAPKFYYTGTFTIEAEKINYLQVQVPMVNFAVSFVLPADFTTYFDAPTFQVTASYTSGRTDQTVTMYTQRAPQYFDYEQGVRLNFALTAVNKDSEAVSLSGSHTEILPGKCYAVTYSLPAGFSVSD